MGSLIIFKADRYRQAKAASLRQVDAKTNKERLFVLIQSDLLEPREENKQEIVELYLKEGDYKNAERYLKKMVGNQGVLKYVESRLEQGKELQNQYWNQLDSDQKFELELYQEFTKGDFSSLATLPRNPVTNLGNLMFALNTKDYKNLPNTLQAEKIKELTRYSAGNELEVQIIYYLIHSGQPEMAKFLLDRLEVSAGPTKASKQLAAEYYLRKQNPSKALQAIEEAIETDPTDERLYNRGLDLALIIKNQEKYHELQQRLNYLTKLK